MCCAIARDNVTQVSFESTQFTLDSIFDIQNALLCHMMAYSDLFVVLYVRDILYIAGIMSSQGSPVKVYIRIRPTANFAHELIECLPDQQVCNVPTFIFCLNVLNC